ncbi:MAG: ABC transporter ATP-binding protein [Haloarculaceae archaeon]
MSSDPLLRTAGLTRRFDEFTAVDGVDIAVDRGELRGLIGPNGAGKTTLFRLLAGDLAPSSGRVYLDGTDVTRWPAHRRARAGVARAFQVTTLFPGLSVRENVLGARNGQRRLLSPVRRYRDDEAGLAAVADLLSRVGLADRADVPVADLSHADAKTLELAVALAAAPDLLLLDEPTAGLAADETARIRDLIDDLRTEHTILLVEHDVDVVMGLADRVTVLHQGAVLAEGSPDDVRGDERVQQVYFGRSTA